MQSISQLLGQDHRQLDALLANAMQAAAAGDLAAAGRHFFPFRDQLLQHIDAEETILFPAFESATGMRQGPTEVMRFEHRHLRELLTAITSHLDAGHTEPAGQSMAELTDLLAPHNMKEENILYPMSDRALGDSRDAILLTIRAAIHEQEPH